MLLLLLILIAQAPVPPLPHPRPAFTSSSELTVLHVSVVDRHAGFVAGLPQDAFDIFEDGRRQPIAFFASDDTPVSVGLVIDSSGSMLRRRDAVIAAGVAFAESSHPDDEMFTLNFNEAVWPGLPPGHTMTSDRRELRTALERSGARGQTALFDAIDAGLRQLERGAQSRKVLIVISDGGDNASRRTFDDVLDQALQRDVVIYAVGIYDPDDHEARPGLLRRLAGVTGGEAFFPRKISEVTPVLERIARDIRSSYTIGYVPPGGAAPGTRRGVRVQVRSADRRLAVRSRSAYVNRTEENSARR
jgi:Ca-activated chloride channel family protein